MNCLLLFSTSQLIVVSLFFFLSTAVRSAEAIPGVHDGYPTLRVSLVVQVALDGSEGLWWRDGDLASDGVGG